MNKVSAFYDSSLNTVSFKNWYEPAPPYFKGSCWCLIYLTADYLQNHTEVN